MKRQFTTVGVAAASAMLAFALVTWMRRTYDRGPPCAARHEAAQADVVSTHIAPDPNSGGTAHPQPGARVVDGTPTASASTNAVEKSKSARSPRVVGPSDAWGAIEPKPVTQAFPPDVAYRFMTGLASPTYHDGVRNNCHSDHAVRAGLILDVESTDGALEVRSVTVNEADPGDADEYQRLCVAQWMTGVRVEIPGMKAGARYRILTRPKF